MDVAIRGVGIRTAGIRNIDDLCDQLIESRKSQRAALGDSLQQALEEADAKKFPVIMVRAVNEDGMTLHKAILQAQEMEHAAIVCTQVNEERQEEVAVLATSTVHGEGAWAVITGMEQGESSTSAFSAIYKTRGPVQEAGGIITACIAYRFGLYPGVTEGEEERVPIYGGQVILKEALNQRFQGRPIYKHLVPISFQTREEGREKMEHLLVLLHRLSLLDLSKHTRKGFGQSSTRNKTVVFAAKDEEGLQLEIFEFLKVEDSWEQPGFVWSTEAGSFYTATTVGENAKIGLFNPTLTMLTKNPFYELYRILPGIKSNRAEFCIKVSSKKCRVRHYYYEILSRSMAVSAINTLGIPFVMAAGENLGEVCLPFLLQSMTGVREGIKYLLDAVEQRLGEESGEVINTLTKEQWKERFLHQMSSGQIEWKEQVGYEIYSSLLHRKLENDTEMFADAFASGMVEEGDVLRTLYEMYQQGCRVFLDLSAERGAHKWFQAFSTMHRDVLVTSLFEKEDSTDSLLLLLAQLMSYGVSFDYDRYNQSLNWENGKEEDIRSRLVEQLGQCQITSLTKWGATRAASYQLGSEEILEATDGSMEKVLGDQYQVVDQYVGRIRMPLPPYLFVSKITAIGAEYGEIQEGSYIEGEFTIQPNTVLLHNREAVSASVLEEAGHIGIFLAAYMGIDVEYKGTARYRITDEICEYYGELWPTVGDTVMLRYRIEHLEKEEGVLKFFSIYEIEFLGKPLLQYRQTGGFYSAEKLPSGAYWDEKPKEEVMLQERCQLYHPFTGRHQFTKKQINSFLVGDLSGSFGRNVVSTPLMYWTAEKGILVDCVLDISSEGGSFGYGYVIAEKQVEEEFWPFLVNQKNDPILPKSIMTEMVTQVITFFECYMGLHNPNEESVPEIVSNHPSRLRVSGEVKQGSHILIIKAEPRVVKRIEKKTLVIYDSELYCDGIKILKQEGLTSFFY